MREQRLLLEQTVADTVAVRRELVSTVCIRGLCPLDHKRSIDGHCDYKIVVCRSHTTTVQHR
jgi:hypothetical protein